MLAVVRTFAEGLLAADRGAPGAQGALIGIAEDRAQPAIVRASALQRLGRYLDPVTLPTVRNALSDSGAMVRAAAVGALAGADAATRAQLLPRMLDDPVRQVRMEAARALAGEPEARLAAGDKAKFAAALDEYVAAQRFNADRPEAHAALGTLYVTRGRDAEAAAAYRKALELDPTYVQAALNLADLQRAQAREDEAERTIRAALQSAPQSAPAHHALGLALVRQKRVPEALAELAWRRSLHRKTRGSCTCTGSRSMTPASAQKRSRRSRRRSSGTLTTARSCSPSRPTSATPGTPRAHASTRRCCASWSRRTAPRLAGELGAARWLRPRYFPARTTTGSRRERPDGCDGGRCGSRRPW